MNVGHRFHFLRRTPLHQDNRLYRQSWRITNNSVKAVKRDFFVVVNLGEPTCRGKANNIGTLHQRATDFSAQPSLSLWWSVFSISLRRPTDLLIVRKTKKRWNWYICVWIKFEFCWKFFEFSFHCINECPGMILNLPDVEAEINWNSNT